MKELLKPESKQYTEAPDLDVALVNEYIELENKQLQMQAELKTIWERQKELKVKMLEQLPGEAHDKYNLNVNGIVIKKSFQDKSSLNAEKALAFARGRRMLSRVAHKAWVINPKKLEAEVSQLLNDGKVTKEDLKELIQPKFIPTLVLDDNRPQIVIQQVEATNKAQ